MTTILVFIKSFCIVTWLLDCRVTYTPHQHYFVSIQDGRLVLSGNDMMTIFSIYGSLQSPSCVRKLRLRLFSFLKRLQLVLEFNVCLSHFLKKWWFSINSMYLQLYSQVSFVWHFFIFHYLHFLIVKILKPLS